MNTRETIKKMLEGRMSEEEIMSTLSSINRYGETVEDIVAGAEILREKATPFQAPLDAIDCCGTGGDSASTYNISTAVALVAAACGVPIAKHGNRASTSKSGAADVLEALGANLAAPTAKLEEALRKFNFAFLMAPRHHNVMKHVALARKKLPHKTIFNLLGPLANPAGTRRQLIGVYDKKYLVPLAKALHELGSEKAWIVHGADGLDEITTTNETMIAILDKGEITQKTLTPDSFGLPYANKQDLVGGDAAQNAAAITELLAGKKSAYRDIVLANTAAVLVIHDTTNHLKQGVEIAATAIDSGAAEKTLKGYIEFTK